MKVSFTFLLCLCMAIGFSSFRTDGKMQLVNKTNTVLDEAVFSRLFLKKLQQDVKDLPVTVTVISYHKTSSPDHLRNGSDVKDLNTTQVNYQCELLLKIGEKTQTIKKDNLWTGKMGTIALAQPSDEELIVDAVWKHLNPARR
jgi:hypothetical protein